MARAPRARSGAPERLVDLVPHVPPGQADIVQFALGETRDEDAQRGVKCRLRADGVGERHRFAHGLGRHPGRDAHGVLGAGHLTCTHAVGAQAQVHAARVPEAGVAANHPVEGRADEGVDQHALVVVGELVAQHLARADALVVELRAAVDGAQALGDQHDAPARLVALDHRRHLQADEQRLRRALAGLDLDEGAGDQGAQARDAAHAQLRLHHPEAGVAAQEVRGLLVEARADLDAGEVLAELDRLHHADVQALVLHARLADLEALRRAEGDRDERPLLRDGADDEPAADEDREERDQPDERRPALPA